jgi:hypothetical protein
MEERLRDERKVLYKGMTAKRKQLEKENPRFNNPYHEPDPMKHSWCITLHKNRLFEEFRDA